MAKFLLRSGFFAQNGDHNIGPRSCKEKKTMMKYLPGNKLVGPAKEAILLEWRSEFVKTLGTN
jgi:hypothetical protein